MDVENFRNYCLSLPHVTEKMPFTTLKDPYSRDVLCFYVGSKWFCYVNIEVFDRCCLKSEPDTAEELRTRYNGIRPAWHMNNAIGMMCISIKTCPTRRFGSSSASRMTLFGPRSPRRSARHWIRDGNMGICPLSSKSLSLW